MGLLGWFRYEIIQFELDFPVNFSGKQHPQSSEAYYNMGSSHFKNWRHK